MVDYRRNFVAGSECRVGFTPPQHPHAQRASPRSRQRASDRQKPEMDGVNPTLLFHAKSRNVWIHSKSGIGWDVFFSVNLLERGRNDLLVRNIDSLRDAVRLTRAERPFEIIAWVVLPEHMHAIWRLPECNADYSTRWAAVKARFSQSIPNDEYRNASRRAHGERGIWQRRRVW
jgi:REP element-mobilizing transposase RayT